MTDDRFEDVRDTINGVETVRGPVHGCDTHTGDASEECGPDHGPDDGCGPAHTPPVTLNDLAAQLEAVRTSIANAEATIERIGETVGPLVEKLSASPLIRMIGGK